MKRIRINTIMEPETGTSYLKQRLYSVFLGNDQKRYFTNLKDAKRFVAETNKMLNSKLHELNYMYSFVFAEYRKIWFYFDADSRLPLDLKKMEQEIHSLFNNVEFAFNQVINTSHRQNGNYTAFKNLFNIIKALENICLHVRELMIERKYYAEVQRLDMFRNMLTITEKTMRAWGDPDAPDPVAEKEMNFMEFIEA